MNIFGTDASGTHNGTANADKIAALAGSDYVGGKAGNATIRAISGPLSSGSMIEIAHRIPECDGAASYAMIRARDSAVKIPTGLYT